MRSVKIPSRIRIKKGVVYEVVYQDVIRGDPDCLGLADGDGKTITIKTGLDDDELLETLVHELLHVITFEYLSIKIPHSLIYKLERPILNLLRMNRWV